ncbi:hypothetical protein [Roseiconus lacunae]|uniref:Uncharacterized protein n=1 Tax=Roseiconus lacunae TaxID=2605694 RepID=A0ABT7PST0_9BACT|nr:hypothetical protein [Roseiconus lacunae]MDM4019557.1 hypothetical protein [Roseiconus lacunae]
MRGIVGATVVLFLAGSFSVSAEERHPPWQTLVAIERQPVVCKVYKLQDLPVWTSKNEFDASSIMHLIRAKISPSSWHPIFGKSTMAPYPKNASLIISTTAKNHERISALLRKVRIAHKVNILAGPEMI